MLHWLGATCLGALFLAAASASAQNVAVVGGKAITAKEFQDRYEEIKRQVINPPAPEVFLEDLIRLEIGVQEAEKRNLRKDPLVERQINEVLYKNMVEKAIGKQVEKITVTEAEMRRFYQDNPEVRTSHILIEFKPGANDAEIAEAQKRAEEILKQVKESNRPFEDLVKLFTDDTLSKQTGGDIGYQSRVTLVPTYYETALKMKIGEVKGLVRTRYGFHIIKLTGKRSYQQANKRQIRAAVFDEKRKDIFNEYFDGLKKKYKIEVNKNLVNTIK